MIWGMQSRVGSSVIAVAALAAVGGGVQSGSETARAAYGANKTGCDVTKPQPGDIDDRISQNGLSFPVGTKSTYAAQHPQEQHEPPGTYPLDIRRDGSLAGKVPWFRDSRAFGELEVRGTRRPGGDRLRARYDNHLGPKAEVVPGALIFPRKGCWRITATSGDARLKATVWVIKVG